MARMDLAAIKTLSLGAEVKQSKTDDSMPIKTEEVVEAIEQPDIQQKSDVNSDEEKQNIAELRRLDKSLLIDKKDEEKEKVKKPFKNKRKIPYQNISIALRYNEYSAFMDYLDEEEINPSQFIRIMLKEKGVL